MIVPSLSTLLLACLLGYLLASIPFGLVLVKLAGKGDVRKTGSGNIGATNVMRSAGKGLGALTLLLDSLKGFLPVWWVLRLGWVPEAASIVALATVLGHIYTPWLKFKGGKGVATALGAVLGYHPAMVVPSLAAFMVLVAAFRYVSLGSIVAALLLVPTAGGWLGAWACLPFASTAYATYGLLAWALVAFFVIWRHGANIKRLLQGTESRFGQSKGEAQ